MTLRVVGAGLGRTGTHSLKLALEQLLGGPCYHMLEVFAHPEHVAVWHAAIRGEDVDWDSLFEGYKASVDWPAAGHWMEMSDHWPDAVVVLSTRDSDSWWRSCDNTIFEVFRGASEGSSPAPDEWTAMATAMLERFCEDFLDRNAA